MSMMSNRLDALGFSQGFLKHAVPGDLAGGDIARVMAVHKDRYVITTGEHDVPAELIGKMRYSAASPLDLPTVGDWVLAAFHDNDTFAFIHHVLPRKSMLKRKTPGKRIDFQLIAANIDVAFIVQSLDANFNLRRLERYVVMVRDSRIEPVALLSKSDLLGPQDIENRVSLIRAIMPDLPVQPFSNQSEAGLNAIQRFFAPRKTCCLLGSSGVGKTTLLNRLAGDAAFKTRTVRDKDQKGRHATTSRQLVMLDCQAMVIDTPGLRELGNFAVDTGLDETFADIATLSEQCRFNDCTHSGEQGCAVIRAVKNGLIPEDRYQNFIKMKKESTYHEMSYLEKRQKDRQFGKHVKTVMKHKHNRR